MSNGESRSFGELLRDLAHGGAQLLRDEIRLVRMELAQIAGASARGTAFVAFGAVLLLLGGLALVSGLVLLVGDQWLPRDRYWLGALIALVVTGGLAGWFARRGAAQLSPARLAPDDTIETLKEDKEWLKRQLTSGATSR